MAWQLRLIELYIKVSDLWEQGVWTSVQRFSNHDTYPLSDQEAVAIYIFGVMNGHFNVKSIYNFTDKFLNGWFPNLGKYESYLHRINKISASFIAIIDYLVEDLEQLFPIDSSRKLLDSMPIMMANNQRSSSAKVALEIADKGYCDTKKTYYHGVKLHMIGNDRDFTIPTPNIIGITPASCHDLTAFKMIAHEFHECNIFMDKAYLDSSLQRTLRQENQVICAIPVKLKKGQKILDSADKLYSTAVSRVRQPIESLFNWLNEKTGIQKASKVRSSKGLMVHIFGKLAAGIMVMLNF